MFYAHKIILVNASSRFKQMLSSKVCEGNPPIIQIHDIRYDIFEVRKLCLVLAHVESSEAIECTENLTHIDFMTWLDVKMYVSLRGSSFKTSKSGCDD